jgi:hypothetical protein
VTEVDSDAVWSVPTTAVAPFARKFDDLREKRVVEFDADAVDHIAVDWPDGGVVLERSDAGGVAWLMVRPVPGPADAETVARLLSSLTLLRADGFVDEPSAAETASLERPLIAVQLSGGGDGTHGGPFAVELVVGDEAFDGERVARGANPGLVRLRDERVASLPRTLVDYRFKELSRFPVAAAKRVEIGFASDEAESFAVTATHGDTGWTSEPEAFGPGKLEALVGALSDLRAVDIAAESLGEAELAALELAPANATFRVYGDAVDGGEPPVLADVRLGKLRDGEGVVAQHARDETVYLIDFDETEYLPVSYSAFENHFRATADAATPPTETAPAPAADAAPALHD